MKSSSNPSLETRKALEAQSTLFSAQTRVLTEQLATQTTRFEQRYQNMVAQFYQAQAKHTEAEGGFRAAQREHQRLHQVLAVKQEVIHVLLPYYPHPITLDLQYQIELV